MSKKLILIVLAVFLLITGCSREIQEAEMDLVEEPIITIDGVFEDSKNIVNLSTEESFLSIDRLQNDPKINDYSEQERIDLIESSDTSDENSFFNETLESSIIIEETVEVEDFPSEQLEKIETTEEDDSNSSEMNEEQFSQNSFVDNEKIEVEEENVGEQLGKDDIWAWIREQCSNELIDITEYEIVWFVEDDFGWDILLKRPIDEDLVDQIVIHASPDGTLDNIIIKEANMDSIPDEVGKEVQNQIEQYVAENESDCVSYDLEIQYERQADNSIIAYCSLIFYYEDGTSFGTLLPIMVQSE